MALYLIFPWLHKIYPHRLTSVEFTTWMKGLYDQAAQLRKENNISRDDYLNFLIELQNKKNTPMDLIHAYAFTLFLDGFETTSYMLGKALNYLAENKESQEKLRAEIKNQDNQITFDELHQLPYLDAVLNGKILNKKSFIFICISHTISSSLKKHFDSARSHSRFGKHALKVLS